MVFKVLLIVAVAVSLSCSSVYSQEDGTFVKLVKDLLQGDELKNFQNAYAALPLEVRDKISKDMLRDPAKLGKDLVNMFGPQIQNMLGPQIQSMFSGLLGAKPPSRNEYEIDNEIDGNAVNYNKDGKVNNNNNKPKPSGGFDFGPVSSMLGNLISSNPQVLINMAQNFMQGNSQGGQGLSFESITNMLTEQFDLDTMLSMASSLGGFASGGSPSSSSNRRGEGEAPKSKGIADILQIQQVTKMWTDFAKSPMGQKFNRVLPRLLKAESLPDALRLLEKETSFRFDLILRQLQDVNFRKVLVAQSVKPIGQFIKSITIPKDLKEVLTKADDILNVKMGLGVKAREYIEPVFVYIRDTFKITHDSLLDLSAEDIEKIASDVLNNEILEPLSSVWDAYEKSRENHQCASFIFCQLNHNFYAENFIRRHVIKTSSIISAFQASAAMKKDAFSLLYESVYKGADGYDCTNGVNNFCLELMHTVAHNEL